MAASRSLASSMVMVKMRFDASSERRVTTVTSLLSELLFQKVMSRQQLRRTRLLELEQEQRLEDEEGLFMTEVTTSGYLNNFILVMIYRNNVNLSLIHSCLSSLNFMT